MGLLCTEASEGEVQVSWHQGSPSSCGPGAESLTCQGLINHVTGSTWASAGPSYLSILALVADACAPLLDWHLSLTTGAGRAVQCISHFVWGNYRCV